MKYLVEYFSYGSKSFILVDEVDYTEYIEELKIRHRIFNEKILLKIENPEQAEKILDIIETAYSDGRSQGYDEGYHNGRDPNW